MAFSEYMNFTTSTPGIEKIYGAYKWFLKQISNDKFIYSEKATKFGKIFTLLLSYVVTVKSKVKISKNIVAFSEYMNFTMERNLKLKLQD